MTLLTLVRSYISDFEVPQLTCLTEIFQHILLEIPAKRKLFIVISSNKSLCGGIHSSVTKATCHTPAHPEHANPHSPVVVIGDKSKGQLARWEEHGLDV